MAKKKAKSFLVGMLVGCGLFVVAIAGPGIDKSPYGKQLLIAPADVESFVREAEAAVRGIRPGLAKEVVWAHSDAKTKTPFALVYFHGFTGSRKELSPVCENAAQRLGANLFFTRFKGHGLPGDAMGNAHFHDWLRDSEEALAIGKAVGEKVILIGTSTGGTLATWLAAEHAEDVAGMVLISPNYGPYDKRSELLLLPWGPLVAEWLEGPTRSYRAPNEAVTKYFTTTYPTRALFPMMAVVNAVRNLPVSKIKTPTLILTGEKENVVDPKLIKRFYKRLGSDQKTLTEIKGAGHLVAGDAWQPDQNAVVEKAIVDFVAGLHRQ